jgi:tryptophan synthase beta subunit
MTWTFWLDVLEVYPIEMVHSAFICFASLGGRYVSPPDIVAIIVEEQRKLGRAASEREAKKRWIVEKQEYAGRQRNRVTAEKAEEIIKEVGLKVRMPN